MLFAKIQCFPIDKFKIPLIMNNVHIEVMA